MVVQHWIVRILILFMQNCGKKKASGGWVCRALRVSELLNEAILGSYKGKGIWKLHPAGEF